MSAGDLPLGQALLETIASLSVLSIGLAALALGLRLKNDRNAARWREQETRWQPLVFACLAGDAPISAVHAAVSRREHERFAAFLARLARRVQGPERAILERIAVPFLPTIARRSLRGLSGNRATALRVLGTLAYRRHREILLAALDARAPLVARTAARIVASHGGGDDVRRLLARAGRFQSRGAAAWPATAWRFGPGTAEALREVLGSPHAPASGRILAAAALRDAGDREAADFAVVILRDEAPPPALALALIDLLARTGDRSHGTLLHAWCASPDPEVACTAIRALGRTGCAEDRALLAEAAGSDSPWIRLEAGRALLELGERALLAQWAAGCDPRASLAREVLAGMR